ncbi:MAG: GNAT family N-acetyltransferase [Bacillota bacterium]
MFKFLIIPFPVFCHVYHPPQVLFYPNSPVSDKPGMGHFFIEPQSIGKGYGKILWNHLVDITCKSLGIYELVIVTSPQAKDFYIKLGANSLGEVESLLKKGRMIPQLSYKVHN